MEENSVFVVEERQLPSLKRSSEFKYLGVVFNGNGLIKYNPRDRSDSEQRTIAAPSQPKMSKYFSNKDWLAKVIAQMAVLEKMPYLNS